MGKVNPILIVALVAAVAFVAYLKISNPYRSYSTQEFWESASLAAVDKIPDEALEPGNRNGPILLWAATTTSDPLIIKALVDRGVDVNEEDAIFGGTPLTGAAGYSRHPEIITALVRLGATVDKTVQREETALMIAAHFNTNPGISRALLRHGANPDHQNVDGQTALDIAYEVGNEVAIRELQIALGR